jgi:membrane protease YdiL (CAAX protease family)
VTTERRYFACLVLLIYVLPVTLILADVIPFRYRFVVLLAMAVVVLVVEKGRGRSWRELGFRADSRRGSLVANGVLSAVLLVGLALAYAFHAFTTPGARESVLFYVFYVLVSSPSQEFLFRSVVFGEMERAQIKGARLQVPICTLVYVFPHAIYKSVSTLLVVAAIGIVWSAIYYRYRHWGGVALSHAVLGATSIAVGLI